MKHLFTVIGVGVLLALWPSPTFEQPATTPPACVWVSMATAPGRTASLVCVAPAKLGVTGPSGPVGPQGASGAAGATGPQGPSAPPFVGGPCSSADGSLALFVQLPNSSCLPVVFSGTVIASNGWQIDPRKSDLVVASITTNPPGTGPHPSRFGFERGARPIDTEGMDATLYLDADDKFKHLHADGTVVPLEP